MKLPAQVVVVPVDFSEMSLQAVAEARDLATDAAGLHVVHVVHVLPPILATEPGVIWGRVDDRSRTEHALNALKKVLTEQGFGEVHVDVRVSASGNAAFEIVRFAEEIGANLICLPSHGRHGLSRLAIGSVAERVVRFAHCPVLVLRP